MSDKPLERALLDNGGEKAEKFLIKLSASKMAGVIAITTPIPDSRGNTSNKTPIYHLPVYNIDLAIAGHKEVLNLKCDLADLTDILEKLRLLKNHWDRLVSSGAP